MIDAEAALVTAPPVNITMPPANSAARAPEMVPELTTVPAPPKTSTPEKPPVIDAEAALVTEPPACR